MGREMERRKYGRQDRRKKRASIHSEEEGLRNLANGKTYRSRRAAPMGSPRGQNHKTHNALATGKRRAEKSGRRSVGRQKKGQMIAHHARYGCQATIKRSERAAEHLGTITANETTGSEILAIRSAWTQVPKGIPGARGLWRRSASTRGQWRRTDKQGRVALRPPRSAAVAAAH